MFEKVTSNFEMEEYNELIDLVGTYNDFEIFKNSMIKFKEGLIEKTTH